MSEISDNEHRILCLLSKENDSTLYHLTKKISLDKSTIKYWLNKLVNKGLVILTTVGEKTTYSINPDAVVVVDGVVWIKLDGQVLVFGDENSELCKKISNLFRG